MTFIGPSDRTERSERQSTGFKPSTSPWSWSRGVAEALAACSFSGALDGGNEYHTMCHTRMPSGTLVGDSSTGDVRRKIQRSPSPLPYWRRPPWFCTLAPAWFGCRGIQYVPGAGFLHRFFLPSLFPLPHSPPNTKVVHWDFAKTLGASCPPSPSPISWQSCSVRLYLMVPVCISGATGGCECTGRGGPRKVPTNRLGRRKYPARDASARCSTES